jgi:hypothetical protein
MPLSPFRISLAAAGAILALASRAGAHDYWLELSNYRPAPGDVVSVAHRVGEHLHGEPVPRDSRRLDRFEALPPAGGAVVVPGRDGQEPAGALAIDAAGSWRIVYQSRPSLARLTPEKFEQYLGEEGLAPALELRRRLGETGTQAREAFSRSVGAIACVSGAPPEGAGLGPAGLELEIVPATDPCTARAGDELRFELQRAGRPAADVQVVAMYRGAPERPLVARTDEHGAVRFRPEEPGFWMIKAVHMERAEGHSGADWRSRWASITFELAPGR